MPSKARDDHDGVGNGLGTAEGPKDGTAVGSFVGSIVGNLVGAGDGPAVKVSKKDAGVTSMPSVKSVRCVHSQVTFVEV